MYICDMRIFSMLLAIYVFALTLAPCADTSWDMHSHSFEHVSNDGHEDHNPDGETALCSPF